MIAAVLFDLDGTLLDTALDFQTATNQLLIAEGREPLKEGDIRVHVANGSAGIIRSIFDLEPSDSDFSSLQNQLLVNYRACLTEKTCLFPGLDSSLALLKQHKVPWGIVTNKPSEYAKPIVSAMLPECEVLICPDRVKAAKPDPEGLFLAADELSLKPENCLYVGDHKRDIDAGRAAGMDTVAVGWGYIDHNTENLDNWQASHVIFAPSQLAPVLANHYL